MITISRRTRSLARAYEMLDEGASAEIGNQRVSPNERGEATFEIRRAKTGTVVVAG